MDKVQENKYKNALVFFVENCKNDHLGITKLNKLFYYLDFVSFRDRGVSVTGEKYKRLPMGPVATNLEQVIIPQATEEGLIKSVTEPSKMYGKRHRFSSVSDFDSSVFDEYELTLLTKICDEFKEWKTDELIAQTHTEAPWVFSKPDSEIDYNNAADIELLQMV